MPGVLDWSEISAGVLNLAGSPADANNVEEQLPQASTEPRRSAVGAELASHMPALRRLAHGSGAGA